MRNKYQIAWLDSLVALVAGMLLPLAFAPFHVYPVAVVSLTLLFFCWHHSSTRQAAWRGFLFGVGFFGVGLSWIYIAIHDFGNTNMLIAITLTALFVSFFALYTAAIGWAVRAVTGEKLTTVDYVLLLPIAWLGIEWLRGWLLTGFPWLEVGSGQIDGPLSGYIPVIGTLGVSMLVALSAGLLVASWQRNRQWLISIILVIWLIGYALKSANWTTPIDDDIRVSLIQGNVPQQIKWDRDQLHKTMALYQLATEKHWDSDLIIWPESAITLFYHQAKALYLDPLAKLARKNKTDILLGIPMMDLSSNNYFNSMVSIGSAPGFYHKYHLVPFGEYLPMQWLRGLTAFLDLPMSSFQHGPKDQSLLSLVGQQMAVYICYEDIFSTEIRRFLPQATVLINATNNAWYGDSFAPHQHLQIARNRALEMGRPVLRATTNGISALISHQGDLQAVTNQFEYTVLSGNIQPRQGQTPYVWWGRRPLTILSLFMLLIWAYYRRNQTIKQAN